MSDDGFLSRWARRKAEVAAGTPVPAEPVAVMPDPAAAQAVVAPPVPAAPAAPAVAEAPPPPTLDDVHALLPGDEISRFVARGVDEDVKRAAVKKLFTDPHYNVMDGLDIYIDDYSLPDPIPMAMLRQMNQAKFMGLFAAEEAAEAAESAARQAASNDVEKTDPFDPPPVLAQDAAPVALADGVPQPPDEDPDLQLQPDDAAGRPGAEERAGTDRV